MSEITITDLFEGAYLLTQGNQLDKVHIEGTNGKTHCLFIFSGNDLDRSVKAYRSGDATVNVVRLKFSMETIKDRMFSSLRHHNKAQRTAWGGRKGYAHARKDNVQNSY